MSNGVRMDLHVMCNSCKQKTTHRSIKIMYAHGVGNANVCENCGNIVNFPCFRPISLENLPESNKKELMDLLGISHKSTTKP